MSWPPIAWQTKLGRRVAVVIVLVLAACAPAPVARDITPPAMPPAESMEPAVRAQFGERRALLDRVLDDPEATDADVAWALGQLGRLFHAYRHLDQAQWCYAEAARLDPDMFEWSYLLGHLELVIGDADSARERFEHARSLRPEQPEPLTLLGRLARESGAFDRAEAHLSEALEHDEENALARYELALTELASGRAADAIERLRRLLEEQPDAFQLLHSLAEALRSVGRSEEARSILESIPASAIDRVSLISADPWMERLTALPVSVTAMQRRGRQALMAGRLPAAMRAFRKSEAVAPERRDVRFNLATALFQAGRGDEAESHLRYVIEHFPDFDGAHRLLGRHLLRSDPEAAKALLDQALALDDSIENHLALGDWALVVDDPVTAVGHYRNALAGTPRSEDAHVALVRALALDGDHDAAEHALAEAFDVLPAKRASTYLAPKPNRLTWMAVRFEATTAPQAARQPRRLPSQPRTPFELETAAMVRAAEGDFETALMLQRRALADYPHPAGDERLARYRTGRPAASPFAPTDRIRVSSRRAVAPSRNR